MQYTLSLHVPNADLEYCSYVRYLLSMVCVDFIAHQE